MANVERRFLDRAEVRGPFPSTGELHGMIEQGLATHGRRDVGAHLLTHAEAAGIGRPLVLFDEPDE